MARSSIAGVYRIVNSVNGKMYIGSSRNLAARLSWHRIKLNVGDHHCQHLQHAWNKYGETNFAFEVIEICAVSKLIKREQLYMNRNVSFLYNSKPNAGSSIGYIMSESTRRKISAAHVLISASIVERKRRSERCKKQHQEGRTGNRKYTVRPRICISCNRGWMPERLKSGILSQSAYCRNCRPSHYGGRYSDTKQIKQKGRVCKYCSRSFLRKRLPDGSLSQSRSCDTCKYERVLWNQGKSKRKYKGK